MSKTPNTDVGSLGAELTQTLDTVNHQFDRWIARTDEALSGLEAGETGHFSDISQGTKELIRTLQVFLHERDRVLDIIKKEAGVVYDTAIDFEQERDAIGRKLDRLRATRDAESVPE